MKRVVKCFAGLWFASLATVAATSALADPPKPVDAMTVSPGGVDLRTGRMTTDSQEVAIGEGGVGGIEFKRTTPAESRGFGLNKEDHIGQFGSNWDFVLRQNNVCSNASFSGVTWGGSACSVTNVSVSVEGTSYNFYNTSSGPLNLISNSGYAKLERTLVGTTQNYYTLTTANGTVAVFQTMPYPGTSTVAEARPVTITHPNGVVHTFVYDTNGLVSVTSNAGYKLIAEHTYTTKPKFITKACVVNLAKQTAGTTCPAGVQSASFGYTADWLTSITDRTGAVWTISKTATATGGFIERFFKPGDSTPYMTNAYEVASGDNLVVVSQDFPDGRHFDYNYISETYSNNFVNGEQVDKNFNLGTGWTANGTVTTSVNFGSDGYLPPNITPTPLSATDPLGRTSTWSYPPITGNAWNGGAVVLGKTLPEGNSETYTYDAYRNRTSVTQKAKPGSGLPDIVTSATFGNCSATSLVACNQPTQTVDAKGNATDITYSPTHGGVLTVSSPADANGIRPVKRTSYVQRNAWISNGAGGYTQMTPAIWLVSEERSCRTTATVGNACAGGSADEVVTTYDYGPNSGPNNLLVRGVAVTADGQTLRTCFRYDDYGRKIAETKPLGTGATCQ